MMDFKVNVNNGVKVKLTEYGVSILKESHDNLNKFIEKRGGKSLGELDLKLDDDGYYHTQLWILMSKFGDAIHKSNAAPLPFYVDIIIQGGEPVKPIFYADGDVLPDNL